MHEYLYGNLVVDRGLTVSCLTILCVLRSSGTHV